MKKIIIIGAGIAGLAAAKQLTVAGFEIIILEAQERYGGRMYYNHASPIPISQGATWVHGLEGNPLVKLANHYRTKIIPIDTSRFTVFDHHKNLIAKADIDAFEEKFNFWLENTKKIAKNQDMPLALALQKVMGSESLSITEQILFQRKLVFFEGYIGADYSNLSTLHWDDEVSFPGGQGIMIDGYQAIIENLAKDQLIYFNESVREIHLQSDFVNVISNQKHYQADAVICTLPLGILQKNTVKFYPELPQAKQAAIQKLGMGVFNIIALQFPEKFCPDEYQALFFPWFKQAAVSFFINFLPFTDKSILVGYMGGDTAKQLELLSEDELLSTTLDNLRTFFGSTLPDPIHYFITRWSQNPFSFGSYSFIPPHASKLDHQTLSESINNQLFFAGEATHLDYPATVHGAYLSGLREADKIIQSFFSKCS